MVERLFCNQDVAGSSPVSGTKYVQATTALNA